MKKLLIILFFTVGVVGANAQKVVWDVACMEKLIANHKVQHKSFSEMENKELEISALQQKVAEKMTVIEQYQSKFYNSLKSVEAILKTGKDIIYCTDIAKDIGKYQKQMMDLAKDDPQLLIVAAKAELELVNRTADMSKYIYQVAIVGTDVNLMDNKQRLDLLKHVISELRDMRSVAYSIVRQMKTAKRNGILQTLYPGNFKYKNNSDKIVDQVLKEYKVNPKR